MAAVAARLDARDRLRRGGLTVTPGQAEVLGARPAFADAPDGGTVATLTLPQRGREEPGSSDGGV